MPENPFEQYSLRPKGEIEIIIDDTLDKIMPHMTEATMYDVYKVIVSLTVFAPHNSITKDEYQLMMEEIDRFLIDHGFTPEPKNKRLLLVGDSKKATQASFDFKAFKFICAPDLLADDAATIYDMLKDTPILYSTDYFYPDTGERKDSGRVIIRWEVKEQLKPLLKILEESEGEEKYDELDDSD